MTILLPHPTLLRPCTALFPTSATIPLDDAPRVPMIILSWPPEKQSKVVHLIKTLRAVPSKSLAFATRDPSVLENGPGWVYVVVKVEFEGAGEHYLLIGEVEVREDQFLATFEEFFRRRGSFYVMIGQQGAERDPVLSDWSIVLNCFLDIPAGSPAPIDLLR